MGRNGVAPSAGMKEFADIMGGSQRTHPLKRTTSTSSCGGRRSSSSGSISGSISGTAVPPDDPWMVESPAQQNERMMIERYMTGE